MARAFLRNSDILILDEPTTPMKSCLYYGIIDEVFIDENV